MRPLLLYGGGGLGREVALLVQAINRTAAVWRLLGWLDDGRPAGHQHRGIPFLGGLAQLRALSDEQPDVAVVLSIGDAARVRTLAREIAQVAPHVEFATLVHPSATLDREWARIGPGTIVAAGVSITSDVEIGSFNVINLNAVVTHDVVIGHRCRVSPAAVINGGVRIGDDVTIGAGAILMPRITIGDAATVAIGAVVGRDVQAGECVAGNPARVVRRPTPQLV